MLFWYWFNRCNGSMKNQFPVATSFLYTVALYSKVYGLSCFHFDFVCFIFRNMQTWYGQWSMSLLLHLKSHMWQPWSPCGKTRGSNTATIGAENTSSQTLQNSMFLTIFTYGTGSLAFHPPWTQTISHSRIVEEI